MNNKLKEIEEQRYDDNSSGTTSIYIHQLEWLIKQAEEKEKYKLERNIYKAILEEIESLTRNPREYQPSYYTINHMARTALNND